MTRKCNVVDREGNSFHLIPPGENANSVSSPTKVFVPLIERNVKRMISEVDGEYYDWIKVSDVVDCIKKLEKELKFIRKKCLSFHTSCYYVDFDYRKWNDPADGLDYALDRIKRFFGDEKR